MLSNYFEIHTDGTISIITHENNISLTDLKVPGGMCA